MRKATIIILTTVLACLLMGGAASAKVGFLGVGGKVGYVKPENIDGTYGLGFFVNLGSIVPALALEGNADYWAKTYDEKDDFGCESSSKTSDMSFGATARYMIPTQSNVLPYVGGGLAVHIVKCEWDFESDYDPYEPYPKTFDNDFSSSGSESKTKIGFHGVAGADFPVATNVTLGGEFKYSVVEDANIYGVLFRIGYVLGTE